MIFCYTLIRGPAAQTKFTFTCTFMSSLKTRGQARSLAFKHRPTQLETNLLTNKLFAFPEFDGSWFKLFAKVISRQPKSLLARKKRNSYRYVLTVGLFSKTIKNWCGKYSIISNTSCLPKRLRQSAQTLIRLLLQRQSDLGLCCLLF